MRAIRVLVAILIGLGGALAPSPFGSVGTAAGADVTILSDDFERTAVGPMWTAGDSQGASGADYWNVSGARAFDGTRSAWCAQVGDQNGTENAALARYDNNMIAYMHADTANLSGYASVSLSFEYWMETEDDVDRLIVGILRPEGGVLPVYTNASDSAGWRTVRVSVPLETRGLEFVFMADGTNTSEGVYVDAIVIVASLPGPGPGENATPWTLIAGVAAIVTLAVILAAVVRRRRRSREP